MFMSRVLPFNQPQKLKSMCKAAYPSSLGFTVGGPLPAGLTKITFSLCNANVSKKFSSHRTLATYDAKRHVDSRRAHHFVVLQRLTLD